MSDPNAHRMLMRQSIVDLAPGSTWELRFEQVGEAFPPGMVGQGIHPKVLSDLLGFAQDLGCTVTKDNGIKAFVFLKRG